ncbi:MAG: helix-turn-helix transcriptional regulator [Bacteroidia bacterium]|jgi:transcriptional regulator with XRE-family HTH domain
MDEINKRIIEFMIKSGHSKSTFARELGVSLPLITHITSGRNKPGLELLQRMLQAFTTLNPDWLLNGEGSMYREQAKTIDLSMELARLNQLKEQITSPLDSLQTITTYHKLLMDELLHLQELNLMVSDIKDQLLHSKSQIEQVKVAIELKVGD